MIKSKEEKQELKSKLNLAIQELEKQYGKGTVMTSNFKNEVDVISTGSLGLDIATGIMGLPKGKIVEFMGWESSGKSTCTLEVIAQAQKKGEKCLLVDGENSFDKDYATNLGVNVDDLLICQPSYGEEGYTVALKLMDTGEVGVVVFDSQTSLLPKKLMEGEPGQSAIGLHARLLSEVVPKILKAAEKNNVLVVFISQFREKIGMMFGDPTTTNGGHSIRFYSHMRLKFSKTVLKYGDESISNKTTVKIIKNKLAPPFKSAIFNIVFGIGIDKQTELITIATELGIIQKLGSWYAYEDSKIGQGTEAVSKFLLDNPELTEEIKNKVLILLNSNSNIEVSTVKQGESEPEEYQEQ